MLHIQVVHLRKRDSFFFILYSTSYIVTCYGDDVKTCVDVDHLYTLWNISCFYEFVLEDANATGIPFKSDTIFIFISHHILSALETTLLRVQNNNYLSCLWSNTQWECSSDLEKYFRFVDLNN